VHHRVGRHVGEHRADRFDAAYVACQAVFGYRPAALEYEIVSITEALGQHATDQAAGASDENALHAISRNAPLGGLLARGRSGHASAAPSTDRLTRDTSRSFVCK
jgi:hypothetical protein